MELKVAISGSWPDVPPGFRPLLDPHIPIKPNVIVDQVEPSTPICESNSNMVVHSSGDPSSDPVRAKRPRRWRPRIHCTCCAQVKKQSRERPLETGSMENLAASVKRPCEPTKRKRGRPRKHDPSSRLLGNIGTRLPPWIGFSTRLAARLAQEEPVEKEMEIGKTQPSLIDHPEEKIFNSTYQHSHSVDASLLHMLSAHADILSMDETESVANTTMGKIGSYLVDSTLSATLKAILNKHGNIAKDCQLRSKIILTSVLEGICQVLHDLENLSLANLRWHHLKSFYSVLKDAEHVKLNVRWLRNRLDEIAEVLKSVDDYKIVKKAKTENTERLETIKKTMDSNEVEIAKLQSENQALKAELESNALDAENLKRTESYIRCKCQRFHRKSLTAGLI